MLLVLSRHDFIEKEASILCVTMRKHSKGMAGLMWYIKYKSHSIEIIFLL